MDRELPGSSSNLYSVSGPSTLILEPLELLVDIETKFHADKEGRYFVMNLVVTTRETRPTERLSDGQIRRTPPHRERPE
jgi:hypothetical protein